MAKISSVIKFTGNLDGMVGMKGANGETYLRKNVKPANPRTEAQVEVRTKMSLAGQLSKLTPPSAIIGLGGSKRERRNRFMKIIMKNAVVNTNVQGLVNASTASIEPEELVFSEGIGMQVPVTIANAEGTARGLKATISAETLNMLDDHNVKALMVIFVWSDNDVYRYVDVKTTSTTEMQTNGVVSLNLSAKANVYVIPLIPTEAGVSSKYFEGVTIYNDNGYKVVNEALTSGYATLGQSVYSGSGSYQANGQS